jgi:arylformamidase
LTVHIIIGCFPWRFVDGESSIARIVAFVEDDRYEELMAKKATCQLTRFGDATGVCKQV